MLNKLSKDEIVKGYIGDYSEIKNDFKEALRAEGFRWNKAWKRENAYGMEGVWFNLVSKASIRIRWGKANPSAIIYIEKGFVEKIEKFLDYYHPNEGIDVVSSDYDILNKGDVLKLISEKGIRRKDKDIQIIEGNLSYLERKKDSDLVRIVAMRKFENFEGTVQIDKLNDFLKKIILGEDVKEELRYLITEAIIEWYDGVKYGYSYSNMFGDRILIGPFIKIGDAKEYQEERRKSIMKSHSPIFDKKPRIVKWDTKRYEYIYTPEKRVVKEPTESYRCLPIK